MLDSRKKTAILLLTQLVIGITVICLLCTTLPKSASSIISIVPVPEIFALSIGIATMLITSALMLISMQVNASESPEKTLFYQLLHGFLALYLVACGIAVLAVEVPQFDYMTHWGQMERKHVSGAAISMIGGVVCGANFIQSRKAE